MRSGYVARMGMVVTLASLVTGPAVLAQVNPAQQAQQQQLQRMQEQVQRLDETVRRMTQLQQRAQDMEHVMLREMEQLRTRLALYPGEGVPLQEQERLRQQEQLRVMAHSVGSAAGEMTQAMLSLREMARSSAGDGELEREMERLRERMQETIQQMEEGLRIMEQLRDRLGGS